MPRKPCAPLAPAARGRVLSRVILTKLLALEANVDALLLRAYRPDPSPLNPDGDLPDWLDEDYLPGDFKFNSTNPDETPFHMMYWPGPDDSGEPECYMSRAEYIELRRHLARIRGYNLTAGGGERR